MFKIKAEVYGEKKDNKKVIKFYTEFKTNYPLEEGEIFKINRTEYKIVEANIMGDEEE